VARVVEARASWLSDAGLLRHLAAFIAGTALFDPKLREDRLTRAAIASLHTAFKSGRAARRNGIVA